MRGVILDLVPGGALELGGVFCAALSGGLAAVRRRFDLVGVLVLAWVAGLGGGMARDVLIGAIPPVGISDWRLVAVAGAAGLVTFFWHPRLERLRRSIIVLDAGALALFVLSGTMKGLEYEVGSLAAVFVGVLTGVGGGILRDVLTNEAPLIFQDKQLYAVPALLGASATAVLWSLGWLGPASQAGVLVLVLGFRLVSLRLGWSAPGPWQGRRGGRGSGRI
ncbi:trimeric intracellular cation channel family protein [Cellulosimicrobium arenosum]|uniref:TRIC cation channel family protein n=1 Tax=Cellulosimicrobium arenosum TaxID=2708133 RepID=A0A927IZ24_9MICO|nr:TRIC cation channel family protein [Cellulosimicrobium arenosum]MBD8077978.1 TRIC cation channel family protein [Cellulosimicrobium arenosum]